MKINDKNKKAVSFFILGMGSTLEIFDSSMSKNFTVPQDSDYDALQSDWNVVGSDINQALKQEKKTTNSSRNYEQRKQSHG